LLTIRLALQNLEQHLGNNSQYKAEEGLLQGEVENAKHKDKAADKLHQTQEICKWLFPERKGCKFRAPLPLQFLFAERWWLLDTGNGLFNFSAGCYGRKTASPASALTRTIHRLARVTNPGVFGHMCLTTL